MSGAAVRDHRSLEFECAVVHLMSDYLRRFSLGFQVEIFCTGLVAVARRSFNPHWIGTCCPSPAIACITDQKTRRVSGDVPCVESTGNPLRPVSLYQFREDSHREYRKCCPFRRVSKPVKRTRSRLLWRQTSNY